MDYPQDFPAESRARVEAARIRAGRQFDSKKTKAQWRSDIEALFWTYVLTPFLVFAEESSRLRLWPVDEMDQNCREFLRRLTIDAYYQKGKSAGLSDMIDNLSCSIRWDAQQKIERTSQWRKYENIRLKFAVGESSSTQNNDKTARSAEGKPTNGAAGGARRKAFLQPILDKKGFSVHDWANEADVDFHTANDYLKGSTKPYQSTRKKLADALGVKVEDLPA